MRESEIRYLESNGQGWLRVSHEKHQVKRHHMVDDMEDQQ